MPTSAASLANLHSTADSDPSPPDRSRPTSSPTSWPRPPTAPRPVLAGAWPNNGPRLPASSLEACGCRHPRRASMADADDVRRLALALPHVTEIDSDGFDFRVGDRGFRLVLPRAQAGPAAADPHRHRRPVRRRRGREAGSAARRARGLRHGAGLRALAAGAAAAGAGARGAPGRAGDRRVADACPARDRGRRPRRATALSTRIDKLATVMSAVPPTSWAPYAITSARMNAPGHPAPGAAGRLNPRRLGAGCGGELIRLAGIASRSARLAGVSPVQLLGRQRVGHPGGMSCSAPQWSGWTRTLRGRHG